MELVFRYTRDDWVEVNTEGYRVWLRRLKPLTTEECVGYVFCLVVSVLAVPGLIGLLAVGFWLDFDWYYLAGAALLLPFPVLMIYAVLWPSAEGTKRGLYHELVFHWKLEDGVVDAIRKRHGRALRRMEDAGTLELCHRYTLRLTPEVAVLVTDFPHTEGPAITQEDRHAWGDVTDIERREKLLLLHLASGAMLCLPRSAFTSPEEEDAFVRAIEEHRRASREHVMVAAS